jgi:hypothetical protein
MTSAAVSPVAIYGPCTLREPAARTGFFLGPAVGWSSGSGGAATGGWINEAAAGRLVLGFWLYRARLEGT